VYSCNAALTTRSRWQLVINTENPPGRVPKISKGAFLMTEPTAAYQAEQPTDAPSETPMTDFLKRNPEANSSDFFLYFAETIFNRFSSEAYAASVIEAWVSFTRGS